MVTMKGADDDWEELSSAPSAMRRLARDVSDLKKKSRLQGSRGSSFLIEWASPPARTGEREFN